MDWLSQGHAVLWPQCQMLIWPPDSRVFTTSFFRKQQSTPRTWLMDGHFPRCVAYADPRPHSRHRAGLWHPLSCVVVTFPKAYGQSTSTSHIHSLEPLGPNKSHLSSPCSSPFKLDALVADPEPYTQLLEGQGSLEAATLTAVSNDSSQKEALWKVGKLTYKSTEMMASGLLHISVTTDPHYIYHSPL